MPTSNTTEDIEFLTNIGPNGTVNRRGRFIKRPRRVNGRNVPGNARYYRRKQREALAGRRAAQRAEAGSARAARAGRNARAGESRAARATAAPAGGQRRGGFLNAIRRGVRDVARNVEQRAAARRERRNKR